MGKRNITNDMSFTDLIFAWLFHVCHMCGMVLTWPLLPAKHIQQLPIHLIRFCGPQEIVSFLLLRILCVHWCLLCYVLCAFPLSSPNLHSFQAWCLRPLLYVHAVHIFCVCMSLPNQHRMILQLCACHFECFHNIGFAGVWRIWRLFYVMFAVSLPADSTTSNRTHSVWFVSGLNGWFQLIPFTWRLFYAFFPVAVSMRRKNRHIFDHQSNWFIFRRLTFDYISELVCLFKCSRHTMSV